MPIYRYQCTDCELEFEKVMSLKSRVENSQAIVCPACGSENCNSLISRTNFSLKGGGWYKDGYVKGTAGD